jgi:uncharacterized membrane protein
MMKRMNLISFAGLVWMVAWVFSTPNLALAQEPLPTVTPQPGPLILYTQYPSRIIGFGESVSVPLKLRAGTAQTAGLEMLSLPEGWTATFRGGSQIIDSVYVDGQSEASVDLRLDPPPDIKAGNYQMSVVANSDREKATLPLSFTIQEKLPPRLSLTVDGLPTKRTAPETATTFSATLKNEGGDDLQVNLSSSPPKDFQVKIAAAGQEVTELPLAANESKNLTITADPLVSLDAGQYPFTVQAVAGDVKTELQLGVEVVGEGKLSVSAPDGRLSAQASAGQETPVKVVLQNTGTAPLLGTTLTSSEPTGWSVAFDQAQIAEIPAGQSVDVTARIKPPDKAVAGDYVVTINARPVDGKMESADFRITVSTSTLWGVAGIGLIALAVAVVGGAVARFGRR